MPGPVQLPRLIGHRGAAGLAPENTLAGIRRAATEGARWVEFDVKLSRDGHLFLLHDDTLDRTTSGHGPAAALDWAAIRALDAGSRFAPACAGERVPELHEVFALLGQLGLGANVEIKPCPGRDVETGRAVALATAQGWPAHLPAPLLSSFSGAALQAARAAAPQLALGLCVEALPPDWREQLRRVDGLCLTCDHAPLERAAVAAIKAEGVQLAVFTVNDRARAAQLLAWGADALFTDRPDRLRDL